MVNVKNGARVDTHLPLHLIHGLFTIEALHALPPDKPREWPASKKLVWNGFSV
jgi:hypothetical protein